VPQIVDFCLQNLVKQRKARVSKVAPEAMAILVRYRWPGNVRELENVIYHSAVIAQGDAILIKNLPNEILEAVGEGTGLTIEGSPEPGTGANTLTELAGAKELTLDRAYDFLFGELSRSGQPMLPQVEQALRTRALQVCAGDVIQTSRMLGQPVVSAPVAASKPRKLLALNKKKS